jgi:uncharacterized protein YcbK (DUF882 family)
MRMLRKILKLSGIIAGSILILLVAWYFIYIRSLWGVDQKTVNYYKELKIEMRKQGYRPKFIILSGKRWPWHNKLLKGAAKNSKHLQGQAIDIVVLDVNRDGRANGLDVDIVYQILDQIIIGDQGGIGTYKGEAGFMDRQMVHFDCRGSRSRWHR